MTQNMWKAIDASYDSHKYLVMWWNTIGHETKATETHTERVIKNLKRNWKKGTSILRTPHHHSRPTWLGVPIKTGIKRCNARGSPAPTWCTDCAILDNFLETTQIQGQAIAAFYHSYFPDIIREVGDYFNGLGDNNFFEQRLHQIEQFETSTNGQNHRHEMVVYCQKRLDLLGDKLYHIYNQHVPQGEMAGSNRQVSIVVQKIFHLHQRYVCPILWIQFVSHVRLFALFVVQFGGIHFCFWGDWVYRSKQRFDEKSQTRSTSQSNGQSTVSVFDYCRRHRNKHFVVSHPAGVDGKYRRHWFHYIICLSLHGLWLHVELCTTCAVYVGGGYLCVVRLETPTRMFL